MFANPFKLKKLGILGMNKRNIHYIGGENDRKYYPLVDNKLKTKVVAENADIAVPKLLATIERQSQLRKLKDILDGHEKFVVKPAQGSGGKGILVIVNREGDTFFKPNGQKLELRDIHRDISNILSGLYSLGGKPDVAMIEELVALLWLCYDVQRRKVTVRQTYIKVQWELVSTWHQERHFLRCSIITRSRNILTRGMIFQNFKYLIGKKCLPCQHHVMKSPIWDIWVSI
jgi:hypothetical protein